MDNYITVAEAAALMGKTSQWVRDLFNRGDLEGKRLTPKMFLIKTSSAKSFRPSPRGNPNFVRKKRRDVNT